MFGRKQIRRLTAERNEWVKRTEDAMQQRDNWIQTAMQSDRGVEYYRGLLDNVAEHLGEEVYIADDGTVCDSPLRAKIPDLVSELYRRAQMRIMITLDLATPERDIALFEFHRRS